MLTILLTIVHVIVSLILVLVVLLQTGKRADLAGAFGGGGSQTAFGTRGAATFLSKMTTFAAVVFMMTSLALSIVSSKTGEPTESVLPAEEAPAQQTLPFQPPEPTESGTVPDSSTGGAAEESSPGEPPVDENEPAP